MIGSSLSKWLKWNGIRIQYDAIRLLRQCKTIILFLMTMVSLDKFQFPVFDERQEKKAKQPHTQFWIYDFVSPVNKAICEVCILCVFKWTDEWISSAPPNTYNRRIFVNLCVFLLLRTHFSSEGKVL